MADDSQKDPSFLNERGGPLGHGLATVFHLILVLGCLWALIYFSRLLVLTMQSLVLGQRVFAGEVFTWSMATLGCGVLVSIGISGLIDLFRNEPEASKQKTAHLAEPWLVKEEWVSGVVQDGRSVFSLTFMSAAVIIFFPFVWIVLRNISTNQPDVWLVYIPLLVWFALAWVVTQRFLQRWRYGCPPLQILNVPLVDGTLRGFVDLPATTHRSAFATVSLLCQSVRYPDDGIDDEIQWRDLHEETKQVAIIPGSEGQSFQICFDFYVPLSAPESQIESEAGKRGWVDYRWAIKVKSGAGLFGFRGIYDDVPVFRLDRKISKEQRRNDRDHYYLGIRSPQKTMAAAGVQFDMDRAEPCLVVPKFRRVYAISLAVLAVSMLAAAAAYQSAYGEWIEAGLFMAGGLVMCVILFRIAFYSAELHFTLNGIRGTVGYPGRMRSVDLEWSKIRSAYCKTEANDVNSGLWLRLEDGSRMPLLNALGLSADKTLVSFIRRRLKSPAA